MGCPVGLVFFDTPVGNEMIDICATYLDELDMTLDWMDLVGVSGGACRFTPCPAGTSTGGVILCNSDLPSLLLCGKTCFGKNLKSSPVGSMSCVRTPTIVYFICLFVFFCGCSDG